MISAFGVQHEISKREYETQLHINPTTKKDRRNQRFANSAGGGVIGGSLGVIGGAEGGGKSTAVLGGGGALLGAGLGAALPTAKHKARYVLVPKDKKKKPVSKRKTDSERGGKVFGNPYLTGALAGGTAATIMGRGRANKYGAKIGSKVVGHAKWSSNRTRGMKNPALKATRRKYADKLNVLGQEIGRTHDTKEVTGRVVTGLGVGTAAGGVVAGRKRLTPVEDRKKT